MTDVGFVIAGYGVILGGAALYAAVLLVRLRSARDESARLSREAEAAQPPDPAA